MRRILIGFLLILQLTGMLSACTAKENDQVTVIGGADGPTAVWIAGGTE